MFDHPHEGKGAIDRLLGLNQGRKTAVEYALNFRTLAAQTTMDIDTQKTVFRRGLSPELQSELACREEGKDLNGFIELTIQIDNLMRARRNTNRNPGRTAPAATADESEPMQINNYHLSPEERNRRLTQIYGSHAPLVPVLISREW